MLLLAETKQLPKYGAESTAASGHPRLPVAPSHPTGEGVPAGGGAVPAD